MTQARAAGLPRRAAGPPASRAPRVLARRPRTRIRRHSGLLHRGACWARSGPARAREQPRCCRQLSSLLRVHVRRRSPHSPARTNTQRRARLTPRRGRRDVCEVSVLKSEAHRALATKHCKDCGCICCAECAPAGDLLPDFSRSRPSAAPHAPAQLLTLPSLLLRSSQGHPILPSPLALTTATASAAAGSCGPRASCGTSASFSHISELLSRSVCACAVPPKSLRTASREDGRVWQQRPRLAVARTQGATVCAQG